MGLELAEKYKVVRLIGSGGMGRVYEGRNTRAGDRRVAIKFLLADLARWPQVVQRFQTEARAAGSLEHENIAAVIDSGQAPNGAWFLVMEYLSGGTLERLLSSGVALAIDRAVDLAIQACRGLELAHAEGIVHRDLKPGNLFVTRRADGYDLVKIVDFGVAKLLRSDSPSTTAAGLPIGTPCYMSPEQVRGAVGIDHRTDIYALGVILYEMLSGRRPFDGNDVDEVFHRVLYQPAAPLRELRPALSEKLCATVARAMHYNAKARYQSVRELREALSEFANPSVASPSNSPPDPDGVRPYGPTMLVSGERRSAVELGSSIVPITPRTQPIAPTTGSPFQQRAILAGAGAMVLLLLGGVAAWGWRGSGDVASEGGRGALSSVPRPTPPSVTQVSGRSGYRPDTMGDARSLSARVQVDGGTPQDAGRVNAQSSAQNPTPSTPGFGPGRRAGGYTPRVIRRPP